MMQITAISHDYVTVEVRETLIEQDYTMVVPELARLSAHKRGELNVLFELSNFRGWDPTELSTKARFDPQPVGTSGRIAVVADDERSGRKLARPLFAGELRTFQPHARSQAERWLAGQE